MSARLNEDWYKICEYEDKYMISSWGNVASLSYRRTGKSRKLTPTKDKNGYLTVSLCRDGKVKCLKVHRLVASHFIPNPKSLTEINHKNGIKADNYFENLEWSTRLNNIVHSYEHGLKPKTTEKQIAAVLLTNSKKKGTKYGLRKPHVPMAAGH